MKKIYQLIALVACLYSFTGLQAQSQSTNKRNCASTEYLNEQIAADPSIVSRMQQIEQHTANFVANRKNNNVNNNNPEAVITIPVVFHVIYNTPAQNISDARLLAQLDVLNKDFAKQNADIGLVPSVFAPLAANTEIQFCLAQRTPAGTPTTGIVRVPTTVTVFPYPGNGMKFTAQGGSDAWDRNQYLNIWVVNIGNNILGFAQFPGGSAATDGVVLLYGSVGSTSVPGTSAPYHFGRTATHEVGHWLNLRHIWGDNFCGDDLVNDTPTQQEDNGGCLTFPHVTCNNGPNGDMFMNYMDYVNDNCMQMFTIGQAARMNAVLAPGGFRNSLTTSLGCQAASGFSFTAGANASSPCPSAATLSASLATTATGSFNTPIVLTATAGVPAGTTVTFSPSPLTPGSSTFVTLNNANTLSNGTYNVTVEGVAGSTTQTTTVTFVIQAGTAPTLTAPANVTVCAGAPANFSVTASGPAVNTYQWQVNTGSGFTNIGGANTASYAIAATTAGQNGYQYRVIATGQCGTATSAAATLTVNSAPAITAQPTNQTACVGSNAVFSVTATGGGLTYVWEQSTNGGTTWAAAPGANTGATYTVTGVTLAQNNYQYRVTVSGNCPSPVTSSAASLIVGNSAAVTGQPANAAVCVGATATFTATATGSSLTYQWQVSTDNGVTWNNVTTGTGGTTLSYTTPVTTFAMNGYRYRLNVFSCSPTPITSNVVTLTVNELAAISAQPVNAVLCAGGNASFSVTAIGTGVTYQWQVSTTGCAGTFTNITGATTNNLVVNAVTAAQSGYAYRVVVTNVCNTVTSSCVTLTVNTPIVVTAQPADVSVCLPTSTATFSVTTTGTAPTYQWQVSTDGGTTWANVAAATSASVTIPNLTAAMSGNRYRVVIAGTCTTSFNSSSATLVVNSPVAITTQPVNTSVCEGSNTTLNVVASGSTITYQWQVNINGGGFTNISNGGPYSGATTATLGIANATAQLSGYVYRVIVSGVPCGSVNSNSATLTVNALPGVVLVAAEYANLTPYTPSGLYSTVSPASGTYTYTWTKDNGPISNTTSWIPVNVDWFGTYDVTVRDQNGCSRTSNKVTVADSTDKLIFIYPNPSTGVFQVRYFSSGNTDYSVNVYDSKGRRVWRKTYPVSARYQQMLVDLGNGAQGVYKVEVRGKDGKRLAAGNVLIQR